ncbi:MAG: taurine transporter subunit, partial [Mesorhizobium sp.]
FVISLVTLTGLIALWFLAARFGWASPLFLPSPADVLTQFNAVAADGYANGTLLDHTLASLGRIAAALGVGIFVGIPLGLLMGLNRWVKGIF